MIGGFLGNPAGSQDVHLAEPRVGSRELAREAVSPPNLKIGFNQAPAARIVNRVHGGNRFRDRRGAREFNLGFAESPGHDLEVAKPHVSPVEHVGDGEIARCGGKQGLGELARLLVMPKRIGGSTEHAEDFAEFLVRDRLT